MKKKFKKNVSNIEIQKLSIISELNIAFITVPYEINKNVLFMEKGSHESRLRLNIIDLYEQCLKYIYQFQFNNFSNRIYAFYYTFPCQIDNYKNYLIFQLENTEKALLYKMEKDLLYKYLKCKGKCITYNKKRDKFEKFTLLHGDLFNGNIIKYKNKYKLIDFEYLLVGKRELELSFLLVWDFLSNKDIVQYSNIVINRDIKLLINNRIINDTEKDEILSFYIPFIYSMTCLNVTAGNYYDSDTIKYCLKYVEWE